MTEYPDHMPQAQLEELVTKGQIARFVTFDDHMRPDVRWITPTEFYDAFDSLVHMEKPKMSDTPESQPIPEDHIHEDPNAPILMNADPLGLRTHGDDSAVVDVVEDSRRAAECVVSDIDGAAFIRIERTISNGYAITVRSYADEVEEVAQIELSEDEYHQLAANVARLRV